jgi:hypothetical protein
VLAVAYRCRKNDKNIFPHNAKEMTYSVNHCNTTTEAKVEPWEAEEQKNEARIADLMRVLYQLSNVETGDWQADKAVWSAVKRELKAVNRNYADIVIAKAHLETK